MAARFADHPEAVAETARLADDAAFDLTQRPRLPLPRRRGRDADATLAEVCRATLRRALPAGHRAARARRRRGWRRSCASSARSACRASSCCTATCSSSRARWRSRCGGRTPRARCCRRAAAAGPRCRRSSATSPASRTSTRSRNELFLGRFLNEELTALPDIDLDFPRDVREVLIPRVHERYGREHSALVAAFPTYRARGAIRELGKALGLPPGEIERVARGSEGFSARAVDRDVERRAGRGAAADGPLGAGWSRLADEAHGLPRHLSQHSGGMIVATRPLVDCCPVVPAAMEGRQMVSGTRTRARDAGFLKIDLLGLGMLSAVERCVEQIARAARRAGRPLADPLRRPGDLRGDPERRDDRRLPDREPRADGVAAPHAAREPRRPDHPGGDRAARADPGRRGQPVHRAAPAPARGPRLRGALRPPVARAGAARHAGDDHLPGPGDRGRDGLRRLLARARPRGCGGR